MMLPVRGDGKLLTSKVVACNCASGTLGSRTTPPQLWSCVQLSQCTLWAADRAYGLILPTFRHHCEMSSISTFSMLKRVMMYLFCKKPNASLILLGRMKRGTPWTAQNLCFTDFLSLGDSWSWSHSFQWSNQWRPGSSWFGEQSCLSMCSVVWLPPS
jgi:hypothetical protein